MFQFNSYFYNVLCSLVLYYFNNNFGVVAISKTIGLLNKNHYQPSLYVYILNIIIIKVRDFSYHINQYHEMIYCNEHHLKLFWLEINNFC